MKRLAFILLLIIPLMGNGQALPTSDISTADIRTALGLTGETTFQAMCTAANVNSYGLNATYCSGSNAAARLTTLQSTPYDIGKFRGYNHNATVPTLTVNGSASNSTINPCGTNKSITFNVVSTSNWTCTRAGSLQNSANVMSGSAGTTSVTITWTGLQSPASSTFTYENTESLAVVLTCNSQTSCQ